jgi:hypothetical protein
MSLKLIAQWDVECEDYIRSLEEQRDTLEAKVSDLTGQLAAYVATVDRMKFDLIMSDALRKPE